VKIAKCDSVSEGHKEKSLEKEENGSIVEVTEMEIDSTAENSPKSVEAAD